MLDLSSPPPIRLQLKIPHDAKKAKSPKHIHLKLHRNFKKDRYIHQLLANPEPLIVLPLQLERNLTLSISHPMMICHTKNKPITWTCPYASASKLAWSPWSSQPMPSYLMTRAPHRPRQKNELHSTMIRDKKAVVTYLYFV